jgi:hypothetical protein
LKEVEINGQEIRKLKNWVEEKSKRLDNFMVMALKNDLLGILKVNLENEIDNINEGLEDIEEAINDAHNNIFTSKIYDLKDIIEKMKNINLGNKKWITDPNNPDFQILKYSTKIYTGMDENNLYFILKIPIVYDELVLGEVIDIPNLEGDVAHFIETPSEMIIYNRQNGKNMEISRAKLHENCKLLGDTYFCTGLNIFNIGKNNCLGKILEQKFKDTNICKNKIMKLNSNTMIIQEINEKQLMIINPSEKEIKIIKNNEIIRIDLPKLSLFKVESKENLKIISDDFELELRDSKDENVTRIIEFPRNIYRDISVIRLPGNSEKLVEFSETGLTNKNVMYEVATDLENLVASYQHSRQELNENKNNIIIIIITIIVVNMLLVIGLGAWYWFKIKTVPILKEGGKDVGNILKLSRVMQPASSNSSRRLSTGEMRSHFV